MRFPPELLRRHFVVCSYCKQVKHRRTQMPLAEGPIMEAVREMDRNFQTSHGMCNDCFDWVMADIDLD